MYVLICVVSNCMLVSPRRSSCGGVLRFKGVYFVLLGVLD